MMFSLCPDVCPDVPCQQGLIIACDLKVNAPVLFRFGAAYEVIERRLNVLFHV